LSTNDFRILAINPGTTSTKFAIYTNEHADVMRTLRHSDAEMACFRGRPTLDQTEFRLQLIQRALRETGCELTSLHAVAGRGGLLRPLASGAYRVNREMLDELRAAPYGEHASNLGAVLAYALARRVGIEAYIVDPVSVDEWPEVARLSGSALLQRTSQCHALNHKAVAKRFARECGRPYPELRLIVVHAGGGTTLSAHQGGRMIENNNTRDEGPFAMNRAGGVPAMKLVELCFSGKYTRQQIESLLFTQSGVYSYLGTMDLIEVERRIAAGDAEAALVYDAMVYQIAKEVGALGAVLAGRVDAILITGGMAHSQKLVAQLRAAIEWIAPVKVYPGEDELEALASGVLRVLRHEEPVREFGADIRLAEEGRWRSAVPALVG
jgi:butyrate kinase